MSSLRLLVCLALLACPARAPSAKNEPTPREAAKRQPPKSEPAGTEVVSSDVTVRIVPSAVTEKGGRALTLFDRTQHFHVVLTNASKQPLRLWRDWCSWGYSNLSFEVTDQGGKVESVTKAPRAWDKNFPDWTIVSPGDHMVVDVTFEPSIWRNAPLPVAGSQRTVSMKAIFEIPENAETKKNNVWTGKVSSSVQTYTLFR